MSTTVIDTGPRARTGGALAPLGQVDRLARRNPILTFIAALATGFAVSHASRGLIRSKQPAQESTKRAAGRSDGPPLAARIMGGLSGAMAIAGQLRRVMEDAAPRSGQVRSDPAPAASDPAEGHDAATPSAIPPRGWWQIMKRVASEASDDRLTSEAASVTFFVLLSVFPAITAMVSLYGLVADQSTIAEHLSLLNGLMPEGGLSILNEQLERLISKQNSTLSFGLVFGILTALWSANQGTKAMFDALNVVYEEEEKRSFIWRTVVTLAFTLGAILFMIVALVAVVALPIALNFVGLQHSSDLLLRIARWPLLLLMITFLLAMLYRYGPSRAEAKWRWVTWGGLVASLGWIGASALFSWYVAHFGTYNATYGSLGAVVGFMTWIWLSSTIILVGAEINAEMEHQTTRDTTTGPEAPMGTRGARMADTVAP